jgi:phytoene dehydrogenase-like protein
VFFNHDNRFSYARPTDTVDLTSGIICCPNNYAGLESEREFQLRLTWIANYEQWKSLSSAAYRDEKQALLDRAFAVLEQHVPDVRKHTVAADMFTPRTIERFTGRFQGAVYGSPRKRRDGRTPFANLFICGTDQGFLGIIGAMLSGITMANLHVLTER